MGHPDQTPHYILQFPFRLPAGQTFSNLGTAREHRFDRFSVRLSEVNSWYRLVIEPFSSEVSARAFVPKVYAGLLWTTLKRGLSPEASVEPQRISYADDPRLLSKTLALGVDRIDSVVDGSCPAIYPSDKIIRTATAGSVNLIRGFDPARVLELVCEAMSFPSSQLVVEDRKFLVALELYVSFFREASESARFLTLTMALEALAPSESKSPNVLKLIDGWMLDVQNRKATLAPESEDWVGYDALEREICFRREVSIRKRIRSLVQNTLHQHGDADAAREARSAVALYDKRSTLIHDGYLPEHELRQATTDLRELVRQVLEVRFKQVATGQRHS